MKKRIYQRRIHFAAVLFTIGLTSVYLYYEPYLWIPSTASLVVNGTPQVATQIWRRNSSYEYVFWLRNGWMVGPARQLWVFQPERYSSEKNECILFPTTHFRSFGNYWISDAKTTRGFGIYRSKLENQNDPKTQFLNGTLKFISPSGDKIEINGL